MTRNSSRIGSFTILLLLYGVSGTSAETRYTFTSDIGGDGFTWDIPNSVPNDLPDSFGFETPDGVEFVNFTNADTFFTNGYTAAANSSVIDGEALWGNPDGGSIEGYFFNTASGSVQNVGFDFAWANGNDTADPFLTVQVVDSDGDEAVVDFDLDSSFDAGAAFNNAIGWEGSFFTSAGDLLDFDENPLDDISEIYIFAGDITDDGPNNEFAIDNFSFDIVVGSSNVFPSVNGGDSDITDSIIVRNVLVNTGTVSVVQEITNDGADATTYSTALVPGGDLTDAGQVSGAPINAGESVVTSTILTFDTNTLSGEYDSDVMVINDGNPTDPTDTFTRRVRVHDAPSLSDNSPVQVDLGQQLALTNAVAGPHDGAVRAGVRVIGSPSTTGPFTVTGFIPSDTTLPGETDNAPVSFDRFGQLNGVYNGTHSVDLEMVSQNGFFLSGATALPTQTWNLVFDLQTTSSDSAAVSNGEIFDKKVGVNSTTIAATLIAGTSSTSQNVSMDLVSNPSPATATTVGESVDLDFDNPGDLFVLQFTYDEAGVPGSLAEQDLRLLFFDTVASSWVEAISGNTDGGAGAAFFVGSFADFLAGSGGGSLDLADLSNFGVDTANNHAWAVLDHASTFAFGSLSSLFREADFNDDSFVDAADLMDWESAFGVNGTADSDRDGDSDGADFLVWQRQFGLPPLQTAATTAVPEPASTMLLIVLVFAGSLARRNCHAIHSE